MEEIRHQLIGGLSCDKPTIIPLFTVFHKDQEFPCLVQDFATIRSRLTSTPWIAWESSRSSRSWRGLWKNMGFPIKMASEAWSKHVKSMDKQSFLREISYETIQLIIQVSKIWICFAMFSQKWQNIPNLWVHVGVSSPHSAAQKGCHATAVSKDSFRYLNKQAGRGLSWTV